MASRAPLVGPMAHGTRKLDCSRGAEVQQEESLCWCEQDRAKMRWPNKTHGRRAMPAPLLRAYGKLVL